MNGIRTIMIAKKRYVTLISNYTVALLYGIYLLLPLRSWIRWSNFAESPLPYFPYDDSFGYLMQIKNIIRNNGAFGNPYLFEQSIGSYDVPDSFIIWAWARMGDVFDLNAIQIYLIMTVFTGFITYLVSLKICRFVGFNNLYSHVVSFLVCFLIYPVSIPRPSPTSLCLWLLLLGILLLSRAITNLNRLNTFKYLSLFCVMILTNPIYAIFLATLSFVYFVFFKDTRHYFLKFIMPLEFVGLGVIVLTKRGDSESTIETIRRLGALKTHFPASMHMSLSVLILIASILIIPKISQINKILLANCFTLLIVLNSQIISGVWWEFESHYYLLFKYLSVLIAAHLVTENLPKYQIRILTFLILLALGSFAINNLVSMSQVTKKQSNLSHKDILLTKELSKQKHVNDVFLFARRLPEEPLPEIALLLNEGFVYWHATAGQWSLTDEEVLNRYGCTLDYSKFNLSMLSEDANHLYIHRFLNADAHFAKWYQLLKQFSLSQGYESSQQNRLQTDFIYLQNNKRDFCNQFKLNFVVTEKNEFLLFKSAKVVD